MDEAWRLGGLVGVPIVVFAMLLWTDRWARPTDQNIDRTVRLLEDNSRRRGEKVDAEAEKMVLGLRDVGLMMYVFGFLVPTLLVDEVFEAVALFDHGHAWSALAYMWFFIAMISMLVFSGYLFRVRYVTLLQHARALAAAKGAA